MINWEMLHPAKALAYPKVPLILWYERVSSSLEEIAEIPPLAGLEKESTERTRDFIQSFQRHFLVPHAH